MHPQSAHEAAFKWFFVCHNILFSTEMCQFNGFALWAWWVWKWACRHPKQCRNKFLQITLQFLLLFHSLFCGQCCGSEKREKKNKGQLEFILWWCNCNCVVNFYKVRLTERPKYVGSNKINSLCMAKSVFKWLTKNGLTFALNVIGKSWIKNSTKLVH